MPKYLAGILNLMVPPRWVNDYQELNANTMWDSFPLPHIDNIPDNIHLTAVWTLWGLYEWTIMPQGGCNAPATHQRRMTDALREHIGKICHVYLDDIIIWSQTLEEHKQNCNTILEVFRKASIYCNEAKSTLFTTELCFLGHIVSGSRIRVDPCKTDHSGLATANDGHQHQRFPRANPIYHLLPPAFAE